MADLLFTDQHILANDETWQNRIQQATANTAFDLIQEDHTGQSFPEAIRRRELCEEVIRWPDRHTHRIAIILASQVPDNLVTTDGTVVTANNVTDAQLSGFVADNWSKLAGVGSSLPEIQ